MGPRGRPSVRPLRAAVAAMILLAASGPSVAQKEEASGPAATIQLVVHPGVPPFTLKLFAGGDEVAAVVFDAQAREVQKIENDAAEPSLAPSLRIEDLNFDGYLDLGFLSFVGATGNVGDTIWLFSPATGRFLKNDLLSETSRLTADSARKELTSRWNAGHAGAHYTLETFRCPGGKPTLVRRERVDTDGDEHVRTIEVLRGNALVRIERKVVDRSYPSAPVRSR